MGVAVPGSIGSLEVGHDATERIGRELHKTVHNRNQRRVSVGKDVGSLVVAATRPGKAPVIGEIEIATRRANETFDSDRIWTLGSRNDDSLAAASTTGTTATGTTPGRFGRRGLATLGCSAVHSLVTATTHRGGVARRPPSDGPTEAPGALVFPELKGAPTPGELFADPPFPERPETL